MKPGRSFTGARTPRLALLLALLGLSAGCVTPKPDLKTPSPNLRLPKPSNVNTTPRELPPKPVDATPPVSIRNPSVEAAPPTTGPGIALTSNHPSPGNLSTTVAPQTAPVRNSASMMLTPANGTYTANPPTGRDAGTNSGMVVPSLVPAAPADALPVAPPEPLKMGVPASPAGK